jgi:hydroxymethylglutaryl-CoA reductase (NADPH)
VDLRSAVAGREIHLIFEYTTGDASGQNMVTIATDAICRHLLEHAPVRPSHWYVEGNMSGDKKATMIAFTHARGKKVVAEATIPRQLLQRFGHSTPEDMKRYWEISVLGGVQSGSIGMQGHYANALAALFIACGQDAACVAEASVGVTRMDVTGDGDLYVSVSMPNLIVGTVGGGTHLPTARECLAMIGCVGEGTARKFAEICAATTLAGEVSITAAMAAGDFSHAHATYGRRRKVGPWETGSRRGRTSGTSATRACGRTRTSWSRPCVRARAGACSPSRRAATMRSPCWPRAPRWSPPT